MSSPDSAPTYMVQLRHLTKDAKAAGASLPEVKLEALPSKKLKGLLEALGKLAPQVEYPATPELRINAPHGMFVVKVTGGRLEFVSWSSQTASGLLTAAQIHTAITGEGAPDEPDRSAPESAADRAARRRSFVTSAFLVVAILLVNSFTVWLIAKPKKTLLPKYALLEAEPAERVLTSASGTYETGGDNGGRQLRIAKTGQAEWIKLGPGRAALEKKEFTVSAARTGDKIALLTSRKAMIEIRDSTAVVLYGDTYRRRGP